MLAPTTPLSRAKGRLFETLADARAKFRALWSQFAKLKPPAGGFSPASDDPEEAQALEGCLAAGKDTELKTLAVAAQAVAVLETRIEQCKTAPQTEQEIAALKAETARLKEESARYQKSIAITQAAIDALTQKIATDAAALDALRNHPVMKEEREAEALVEHVQLLAPLAAFRGSPISLPPRPAGKSAIAYLAGLTAAFEASGLGSERPAASR